jgi:hypothetical protein
MTDRFPAEVARVLSESGWSPGRRYDQTALAIRYVCQQVGRDGAKTESFEAAVEALTEFGGLYVVQDGPGRDLRLRPFALDPAHVAATTETLADLGRVLDTVLFPLGMEGNHDSVLAIDRSGRVFAIDHTGVWFLGSTIDAALVTLIFGIQPPRLDDRGRW